MSVLKGTEINFEKEVLLSKQMILVDFNANWCGPCRMLAPILEEISEEINYIKVVSIDVDEEEHLASQYEVTSIPCLILFQNGQVVKRRVGFGSKQDIQNWVMES